MRHKKLLFFVSSAILSFGIVSPFVLKESKNAIEPDNADYGTRLEVDFNNPDIVYDGPIEKKASSESTTKPAVVKIHYHNSDGANLPDSSKGFVGRELWVWCPGVNGFAAPLDSISTATDATVTIDFNQPAYAEFKGKPKMFYIVKYKDTWGGQSENVELNYTEYPADTSGLVEVWAIPGEGNAVEMYPTKELSEMDRFVSGTFDSWKSMSIIATDIPSTYKLYALTTNYMKLSEMQQEAQLENYLIASGSTPACTSVTVNGESCKKFTITLNYTAKVNVQYYLTGIFPNNPDGYTKTKYISFHNLYETSRFEQYYNYTGADLGVTYNGTDSATFKVWAPTAASVRTILYDTGTSEELALPDQGVKGSDRPVGGYDMAFTAGGVWQITIKGQDLNGYYYTYRIQNSLGDNYAIDPYAKACGVNGDRGMIVDWNTTNPTGWDQLPVKWDGETSKGLDINSPNELSIYETHIRDLTMDSSWKGSEMAGTYSAFVESGTKVVGTSYTSGYDHLVEMGYKAIHLLPVFDHDNNEEYGNRVYNWGYNPKNYNCVEGSYATDPYDGASRVKEFKGLVQKFANNENHTRIIMDVVYNHVASAPASSFNKLMPRYYFRYWSEVWHENTETYTDEHGVEHLKYANVVPDTYCDGSGCGNEVKSEAPMMSKYIVDSLCWWAQEYKIKGFRFDLMGLIDWQTIKKAAQELYKIDPDILIYGEGWTGDGDHAHILNWREDLKYYGNWGSDTGTVYSKLYKDGNMCYVATFNDAGRNELKGGNNGDLSNAWGFIDQGTDVGNKSSTVADMMIGFHTGKGGNPNQSISYASCHDNYALFDTLVHSIGDKATNSYENPGLACAGVAAVECAIMFSNGIALVQGGEELFRSKEVTTPDDIKLVKDSDCHTIKDHKITHNAYNLSDAVSAFKWDRKVSINGVSTIGYVQEMAKAVKLRNSLTKYDYDYFFNSNGELKPEHNPFSSSSEFNVWGQGNGSNTIAIRNKNYFCFINGVSDNNIPFGAYYTGTNKVGFTSNETGSYHGFTPSGYGDEKGITLGWYTTVCLYS